MTTGQFILGVVFALIYIVAFGGLVMFARRSFGRFRSAFKRRSERRTPGLNLNDPRYLAPKVSSDSHTDWDKPRFATGHDPRQPHSCKNCGGQVAPEGRWHDDTFNLLNIRGWVENYFPDDCTHCRLPTLFELTATTALFAVLFFMFLLPVVMGTYWILHDPGWVATAC